MVAISPNMVVTSPNMAVTRPNMVATSLGHGSHRRIIAPAWQVRAMLAKLKKARAETRKKERRDMSGLFGRGELYDQKSLDEQVLSR